MDALVRPLFAGKPLGRGRPSYVFQQAAKRENVSLVAVRFTVLTHT